MENRIQVLDNDTANKIAAGEVIERPASVVKELVENAIDAGATRIDVRIEAGGKRLIEVCDDGCGMSPEDAVVAFQRHATSKIRCADDLFRIATLGFRGEALPSIASVSQVELTTRAAESAGGVRLRLEGGVVSSLEEVGCPPGTQFQVRNLFYNTPARLKFLRTEATEAGHISDFMSRVALSHRRIAFTLDHNGVSVLRSTADEDPLSAVVAVYGREAARQMLPILHQAPALKISGYASKPSLTRANRTHQSFFVNRRLIRNRSLSHAVYQAYQGLLPPGRHPVVIVLIEIDPTLVDANVHPTKSEVRFTREWEVHNLVLHALRQTLTSGQVTPELGDKGGRPRPGPETGPPIDGGYQPRLPVGPGHSASTAAFRREVERKAGLESGLDEWTPVAGPVSGGEPEALRLRPLGQVSNTYLVCESEDGIVIVNQHRAHERVLCDRHLRLLEQRRIDSQRLVIPCTVSLSHREAALVSENLEALGQLGFEVEPFGADTFLVRAMPVLLGQTDGETALRDLVDDMTAAVEGAAGAARAGLQVQAATVQSMLACRAAIKAGDAMTEDEIARLIEDLMACDNPYVCPHGQPILIRISQWELDRKFERR